MHKFILLMMLSGTSLSTFCQTNSLSGITLDEDGKPLSSATIRITPGMYATASDDKGAFVISGLPYGRYTLTVTHVGYLLSDRTIDIDDTREHIQIQLKPASQELSEVVVSADHVLLKKKEESLNVEVVNRSFIRKNLGGSLMQSLERLPGISMIGIGSGQSKPLIRGLGFNRVVVVDKGVKHEGQQWGADHGLEIDQFAVHEADVIKGAASFVYGSDAIGGAIDIKPSPVPAQHSLGGSVDLIGKSNNNLYGTSVNLFGRNYKWFFDSRVTYQNYGDYRVPTEKVYVYDYGVDLDKHFLRNSAGRETGFHLNTGYAGDSIQSIFYISNVYSTSGFFANAHGLEPRRVDTNLHDQSNRDIQMPNQQVNHFKIINRTTYSLAAHSLEMDLGYQHNFRQEFSQYINHGYMPPLYPSDMSVPHDLEREFDKHVYTANLRDYLKYGKHNLTIGLNSEHQNNVISGWSFLVPAFRQTTAGIFAYDKFQIGEKMLLHGAIRYDFGRISMFRYQDWFATDTEIDEEPVSFHVVRANDLSRTFNSIVWSVGVNYNLDAFDLKVNVGKSFRMPIAKELGANGVNYHYFSYERGDANLSTRAVLSG